MDNTKIHELLKHINTLLIIENHLAYRDFPYIFGDLADHLYQKWTFDKNVLHFLTRLDSTNQEKLLKWALSKGCE